MSWSVNTRVRVVVVALALGRTRPTLGQTAGGDTATTVTAVTPTVCTGQRVQGDTTTPAPPCACSADCHSCTLDSANAMIGCTLCRNEAYLAPWLPTPTCHASCHAFPWTLPTGRGQYSRVCRPLPGTLLSCATVGANAATVAASPWLVNRCTVSNSSTGCPAGTAFDVTAELAGVTPTDPEVRICADATQCDPGTFERAPPSATADRVCNRVSATCASGQYEAAPPTATTDRNCTAVTTHCASNAFDAGPPTATSDRVCTRLTKCSVGRTVQATAPTATTDRECRNVTACSADEYQISPPTLLEDRRCTSLTACPNPSTFEAVGATATTDRACGNTTLCPSATYQTVAVTATADAECTGLTVCDAYYVEVVPPTYTSDRTCALADIHQCRFEMRSNADLFSSPARLHAILPALHQFVVVGLGLPSNAVSQSMVLRSNETLIAVVNLPRFADVVTLRNSCATGTVVLLAEDAVLSCQIDTFVPEETSTITSTTSSTTTLTTPTTVSSTTRTATSSTVTTTSPTATTATATSATTSSTGSETTTVTTSSSVSSSTTTTSTATTSTRTMSTVTATTVTHTGTSTVTATTSTTTTSTTQTATVTTSTATSTTVTGTGTSTTVSATATTATATTATVVSTTTTTTSSTVTTSSVTTSSTGTSVTSTTTTATSTVTNFTLQAAAVSSSSDAVSGLSEWIVLAVGLLLFVVAGVLVYRNRRGKRSGYDVTSSPTVVVNNAMASPHNDYSGPGAVHGQAAAQRTPLADAIGLSAVGSRVTVLGYAGEGTLRYYGRHAFQPGFRCGVELDGPHGKNSGTVMGYYYFTCPEQHGVLVDVRKVTLVGGGGAQPPRATSPPIDEEQARIGDDGIADGDSAAAQIASLQRQMEVAEETFAEHPKRRPDAAYEASEQWSHKNRYRDIAPYDDNRVRLSGIEDYINASYVRFASPAQPLNAVCSQGPKPDTVDDTWRMIAEHRIAVIVMVTNLHEGMSNKCTQYWPRNEGESEPFGDCEVHWSATTEHKSHVVRELRLVWRGETRTVHQVQFIGWPDHGVPTDATDFLRFAQTVDKVKRGTHDKSAPVMVHCSAGVGRTGVFLMLHVLLDKLRRRIVPHLGDVLAELRRQRMLLVQTPSQFQFCHEAAIAALRDPKFEYF
eukprot:CAMPEP_0182917854 /NCGR_PEP_ID=MMETSP0105_2-20130417/1740_1 /TAXON_ID=81532 ORGANISM="Acanthoeca-like sp., Strain 10tr" /NCGR_SAMPLE_ID=MMETSP0105_2 /ASSEMBLY_ACC=CAM_ASM_000205 /LENGTH=1145 /DNA_ID=CAMNT_0025054873 /DNA_START=250 /DNA_END=3687 /DNA_ORIENTATION=-